MGIARLRQRINDHRIYINYWKQMPDTIDVVFACDKPADAQAAERTGKDLGVVVVGTDVDEAASYIISQAQNEVARTEHA